MTSKDFFKEVKLEWCASEEQDKPLLNDMMKFAKLYHKEQLILSGVSDIVHRAELKVLENVSDYIPCEIYSQAVIFSQKKRDNVR